jgi:hypothetical protein
MSDMGEDPKLATGNHPVTALEIPQPGISDLMEQIRMLNINLERDIHSRANWKLALRNGVVGAIGGLVGSTILLAVVVHFVKPIAELRPALERLAQQAGQDHQ